MLHGDHLEGSMDRVSSQLHLEALTKMLNKVNIDDLKFNFRGKRLSIEDINSEFRQSFLQKRSEIVSEINLGGDYQFVGSAQRKHWRSIC